MLPLHHVLDVMPQARFELSNPYFRQSFLRAQCIPIPSLRHIKAVCPAVNRLSDLSELHIHSSTHELVAPPGFKPGIKNKVWACRVCQFHHGATLPVFPGCQPRAGHFRRKKYHDTSLIILTKITIKCLF